MFHIAVKPDLRQLQGTGDIAGQMCRTDVKPGLTQLQRNENVADKPFNTFVQLPIVLMASQNEEDGNGGQTTKAKASYR